MGDFIKTLTSLIGSIKAKTDGKIGILQKRIDDIPTETVLYTPQTLTEEQQKQARDNIGATDAGSMFVVITKSVQNGETIYSADKTYDEIMEAVENRIVPVCNNPIYDSAYGPDDIRCIFRNSFYMPGTTYAAFQSDGDEYFYEVLIFNGGKVTATSKPKIMTGATTDNNGTSGMVPLPYRGDNTKFLRGDGRWADVPKYELPVAANEQLGGVKPVAKTDVMTQDVGVDENGKLYTKPAEGGTDFSLGITGATPGQIAKITAVDTDGKPTKWEPVDMAGGGGGEAMDLSWKHIRDVELTPDIIEAIVSTTDAGDAFSYDEIMIEFIPNLEGYFYVRASQNALYSKNIQVWVTNSKYSQIHLGLLNKKIAITSAFRTDGSLGFSNGYGGNGDIDKISMLVFGASAAVGAAFTVKIWGR